jgi:hypothetical protein
MSFTPSHNYTPSRTTAAHRRSRRAVSTILLAAGAITLGACGGASPHATTPTTSTPVQHAVNVQPEGASVSSAQGTSGSGASRKSGAAKEQQVLRSESGRGAQAGQAKPGTQAKGSAIAVPKGPNPCVLITSAEAQSIIGSPITRVTEAPLGPTCILSVKGQRQTVTLAVESAAVAKQIHQMRKIQQVTVAGRRAYCGQLGRPMLDVQLSSGKILNVTAPCAIAQALAAKAVPRISA